MLDADVFILHLLGLGFGRVEGAIHLVRDIDLLRVAAGAGHLGQRGDLLGRGGQEVAGFHPHFGQQLGDQPVLLLGERDKQMFRFKRLVGIFDRQALGVLDGLDGLLGKLIGVHKAKPPSPIELSIQHSKRFAALANESLECEQVIPVPLCCRDSLDEAAHFGFSHGPVKFPTHALALSAFDC